MEASQPSKALKSLLREEIESVLRPPRAAAQLAEAEAQLARLLGRAEPSGGGQPPPAVPSEPLAREVLRQVQEADAAAEALPEEKPPPPAPRRLLVHPEAGREADVLRQQVADARRRLEAQDREVTKLTRELKLCRTAVWEQQRLQSASEASLARLIAERIGELPSGTAEELKKADAEARELAQNVSEARTQASLWSSRAKRQDTMLQQELEAAGGDALSLIARHPAGEVFLVRQYHRDIDSEDGYSDGPRGYGIRRQASLDDADMTSEDETATTATGGGPLGFRPRVGVGSAQDSDSSVPPSPSDGPSSASAGTSGGVAASLAAAAAAGRGGAAQRKGGSSSDEEGVSSAGPSSASAGASGGVAASLAAAAAGRNGGFQRKNDTSSDEEPQGRRQPTSAPDVAVSRGRPVARADEVEEVSSEEDIVEFEEESDESM